MKAFTDRYDTDFHSETISAPSRVNVRYYQVAAAKTFSEFSWSHIDDRNNALLTAWRKVVARMRDMDINNPYAHGAHSKLRDLIIGNGLTFRPAIKSDPGVSGLSLSEANASRINRQLAALLKSLSRTGQLDATGKHRSFYTLQAQAYRDMCVSSAVGIKRIWNPSPGRVLPLAIELVDALRIATPYDLATQPTVVDGIEYTDESLSEVKGYWVRKPNTFSANKADFDFVDSRDMIYAQIGGMPGCSKTLPVCTAAAITMKLDIDFVDAIQHTALSQAYPALFVTNPEKAYLNPADHVPSLATSQDSDFSYRSDSGTQSGTRYRTQLGQAAYIEGLPGQKFEVPQVNLPQPSIKEFQYVINQVISIALDIPMVLLDQDVEEVSYAGGTFARQLALAPIEIAREEFIGYWRKVYKWIVEAAAFTGVVKFPGYSYSTKYRYMDAAVVPAGQPAINPVQTENAYARERENGTISPSLICDEKGRIYDDVLDAMASDYLTAQAKAKERGVPLDVLWSPPQPVKAASAPATTAASKKGKGM